MEEEEEEEKRHVRGRGGLIHEECGEERRADGGQSESSQWEEERLSMEMGREWMGGRREDRVKCSSCRLLVDSMVQAGGADERG